jgi:hypothetical protein
MADMTLDELRDAHAKRLGWEPFQTSVGPVVWHRGSFLSGEPYSQGNPGCHPVSATLDAIAALMPSGWLWGKGRQPHINGGYEWRWWAENSTLTNFVDVVDTGDELTDRARLAWLAWEAEAKGAK